MLPENNLSGVLFYAVADDIAKQATSDLPYHFDSIFSVIKASVLAIDNLDTENK